MGKLRNQIIAAAQTVHAARGYAGHALLYSVEPFLPMYQLMTVKHSLVVSALLATDPEEIDSVLGLVEVYRHATASTRLYTGRKHRAARDTARLCEAMLIEHLIENCRTSAVM